MKRVHSLAVFLLLLVMIVFFQNCSNSGFNLKNTQNVGDTSPAAGSTSGAVTSPPVGAGFTIIKNFNKGPAGSRAEDNGDDFNDAAGGSYYTADHSAEGGLAAELNIGAGQTAFGSWGGIVYPPSNLHKGTELWYRVKMYWPAGFNYNANPHLKFLRVHTRSDATSNEGYDDWYINPTGSANPFKVIFEGEQVWTQFGSATDIIQFNTWETYEMYLYLDDVPVSQGGKARIRVWKNGKLLKDIINRKTLVSSGSYANGFYLFTYWNGSSPQTQKAYVDDMVITTQTPTARDAQGNPYVGVGTITSP